MRPSSTAQQKGAMCTVAAAAAPCCPIDSSRIITPGIDADIERYHRDGAVCVRGCISTEWLEFLRAAADELEASPGPMSERMPGPTSEYFTDLEMAQRLSSFGTFTRQGPCAALAGRLMGASKVCALYDQFFRQSWGEHAPVVSEDTTTPYHQDQPYWSVSGTQVVSIWAPLDVTPAGAAVGYVAGSHRWREHSPFHFDSGQPYKGTGQPLLPDIDNGIADGSLRLLRWPDCRPGDAICFSAMVVHGQPPPPPPPPSPRDQHCGGETDADADTQPLVQTAHPPAAARSDDHDEHGESGGRQFRRIATRWTGDDARYRVRCGEARDVVPSRYFPCTLKEGDEMACARFPVVWTRPQQ